MDNRKKPVGLPGTALGQASSKASLQEQRDT